MTEEAQKAAKPSSPIRGMFSPNRQLRTGGAAYQAPARPAPSPQPVDDRMTAEAQARERVRQDQRADAAGFVSRQPAPMTVARRRRIVSDEVQQSLSMRMPLSVHRRFVNYTNNVGAQSYWDAIERLMNAAGVGPDGEEPAEYLATEE